MLNILFFGSSIHSLKIINALVKVTPSLRCNLVGIVSQPDRPNPTPVSEFAIKNNIPLLKPMSLPDKPWEIKDPQNLLDFIKSLNPDLIIVSYYGQKIPSEVINFPKFGSLNIHPSLLPNYPGSSPAVWAILEGEKKTGVTIIKMNENFDEGEIVAQVTERLKETDTPEDLYERLFTKGAELLIKTLPDYLKGKIISKKQGHRTSVYAKRLTREDGKIDWTKSPEYLERFIRAMSPWPGAWTEIKIKDSSKKPACRQARLKILKSHTVGAGSPRPSPQNAPALIIDLVQLEGKNPVTFKQFQEGYSPELIEGLPKSQNIC